jgi:predicted transcriptional regulator
MLNVMDSVTKAMTDLQRRLSECGLSAPVVANAAGVKPNTVRRFLRTGAANRKSLERIERALNGFARGESGHAA